MLKKCCNNTTSLRTSFNTWRHREQDNPDAVESNRLVWKASDRPMDGDLLYERQEVIECQHAALHEESHCLAETERRNAARTSDHNGCIWKEHYGRRHTGNIMRSHPIRAGRLLFGRCQEVEWRIPDSVAATTEAVSGWRSLTASTRRD